MGSSGRLKLHVAKSDLKKKSSSQVLTQPGHAKWTWTLPSTWYVISNSLPQLLLCIYCEESIKKKFRLAFGSKNSPDIYWNFLSKESERMRSLKEIENANNNVPFCTIFFEFSFFETPCSKNCDIVRRLFLHSNVSLIFFTIWLLHST